jgi:hypothetical protein
MRNIRVILLAGYTDLFKGKYETAQKKIDKYPLQVVLCELVGLNFRVRGNVSLNIDVSPRTQMAQIAEWLGDDDYAEDLYNRLNEFSRHAQGRQPIIFNRAGCLYGIDYCYRNLKPSSENFDYTRQFWIDLIEFCLSCNEIVTQYESAGAGGKISLLEHVNAQQAILNELKIVSNPILLFNRYIDLVRYFEADDYYGKEFFEYLTSLGLVPKTFIESLILIYLNKQQNKKLPFYIWLNVQDSPDAFQLLTWLSSHKILEKKHDMDLLMLYKWPVYRFNEDKFVILDPELLLDKMYRQLINDFFFEWLKPKGITYQNYREFIGKFFEGYITDNFISLLADNKALTFKHTSQLLFGNPQKELCDIYLRHKKNVMLCQIKSTNISDAQKFEGPYAFYNGNTERFYKDVGVSQILQSIEWLNVHSQEIDEAYPSKTIIYPVIILNDKFFETPFMSQVLNNEFRRRLALIANRFVIRDLIVMNVNSVERLHVKATRNGRTLWKLFWSTVRYNGILPHFNNTLDRFNIHLNQKRELRRISGFLNLKKEKLKATKASNFKYR